MNNQKLDEAIKAALKRLANSPRGRMAACDFKTLMRKGGGGLDSENGHALCVLVIAALKEVRRDFLDEINEETFGYIEPK